MSLTSLFSHEKATICVKLQQAHARLDRWPARDPVGLDLIEDRATSHRRARRRGTGVNCGWLAGSASSASKSAQAIGLLIDQSMRPRRRCRKVVCRAVRVRGSA